MNCPACLVSQQSSSSSATCQPGPGPQIPYPEGEGEKKRRRGVFHQLTACLPADSQERAGERGVKGVRYLGSQAQVQCGPPYVRPAMYTPHGGTSTCACWPCLPPPSSSSSSFSYPAPCLTHPPKGILPSTRRVSFKPQSGDDGRGAIGAPSRSHNLESLCCRIVFFRCCVRVCLTCLACPASLCHHAMPVGVRNEPFLQHTLCDMTVAH